MFYCNTSPMLLNLVTTTFSSIIQNSTILSNVELLNANRDSAQELLKVSSKSLLENGLQLCFGMFPSMVTLGFSVTGFLTVGYFMTKTAKEVVKQVILS